MNRITLGLAVIVALCFAMVGCGSGAGPNGSAEAAAGVPQEVAAAPSCSEQDSVFERIECFADLATEVDAVTPCDAAADEGVRFQCYAIFAERSGDPDPCRAIPVDSQDGQSLRDACLADVAPVIERTDLCQEVVTPGLRDSCYLAVFRETGDEASCARIEDAGLQSLCTGEPVIVD